jgi:hypothetical protein
MSSPLGDLKIDSWYKLFIAAGGAALLACIVASKGDGALISIGVMLVGSGAWKDHPRYTEIVNVGMGVGTMMGTGYRYRPTLLGWIFVLVGVALVAVGTYRTYFLA